MDRDLGNIETLRSKAVDFSSVNNSFLMPLDAFFVKVFTSLGTICSNIVHTN